MHNLVQYRIVIDANTGPTYFGINDFELEQAAGNKVVRVYARHILIQPTAAAISRVNEVMTEAGGHPPFGLAGEVQTPERTRIQGQYFTPRATAVFRPKKMGL